MGGIVATSLKEWRRPEAILIAGPTASGKSTAALALADRLGGTVINADSMQVYRELRVLSARPSAADEARAPHRLYGIVSAAEAYSVGRWLEDAARAMEEARQEASFPIVVGGTGLYFKALTEGLAPVPEIPDQIRRHWREQAAALEASSLHAELAARDSLMAARVRADDPQRMVRALEVIQATGVSLAEWQEASAVPLLDPAATLRLVIGPERETIYASIDARFDRMIAEGALEEVRDLLTMQLGDDLPAMRAHGVRELAVHLEGRASLAEAIGKAKTESRRYAKRQMTWLRRFMADWDWYPDSDAAIAALAERSG